MLLVISFVVFMLLGLPLFGVIGLASIISMIGMPFPMEFIPQNLYTGMDQFPLIAIKATPSLRQARMMRMAISPRLATRTLCCCKESFWLVSKAVS